MTKSDYDAFTLLKANASIVYPQYPPHILTPSICRIVLRGRPMFYVALFALLPSATQTSAAVAADAGIPPGMLGSAPRLLATGPPRDSVPEAMECMLEFFLAKDLAREVNFQAARCVKVERRENELIGYTFEWPEGMNAVAESAAGTDAQTVEPPPAYED